MTQKHVQLEIENHKIAVAVYVNEILLFTNRYHQEPKKEFSINQWIGGGTNSYRVNIWINPHWFEKLEEQSLDMYIKLFEGIAPEFSSSVLAELHWKYVEDTKFPVVLEGTFEADVPYGNWIWNKADALSEETVDLDSLKRFISNYHHLLNTRNYESLAPMLTIKATELASAYYIPVDQRIKDQKEFFEEALFSDPAWGLQPLDLDSLVLQFHSNGKLIEVLGKDGKSPLRSNPLSGEVIYSLGLHVCHLNGQWILCR